MKEWEKFDQEEIEKEHGPIYYYRGLYEGKHSKIFPRAKNLIDKGEIVDNLIYGTNQQQNVQTPYIMANLSKLIPEIPAILVTRSLGKIRTTLSKDDEEVDEETLEQQQEIIKKIQENSHLTFQHWGNIVQQQVDGGLVGVPWLDDKGLRLEFKARDVYFPHSEGIGADLCYEIEIEDEKYLHVYREEIENNSLHTRHILYYLDHDSKTEEVSDEETKHLLGINELENIYTGHDKLSIIYWPNEKTFMNPLGTSALKGQDAKQDEINWTLTRNAITYERNGKPRIAVSGEIMRALQEKAMERYGDESKIDHRDLEITQFDEETGKAMEIIQIDTSKIGDVAWVKDLMKMMLMETKTSEKAIDFYMDNQASNNADSGVAKFYDLFTSIVKAEQIQQEYVYFLQQLFQSAMSLLSYKDESVIPEKPDVSIKSMIPISRKELIEENQMAYESQMQSLETTIRRNNPNASEDWLNEEIEAVESEKGDDDSFSLENGRQNLQQMMGNRDSNGNPLDNNGNPMQ